MAGSRTIKCVIVAILCCVAACRDEGPSPALSPEEELATFRIERGLTVELVAAEPMVEEPVVIVFDAAGRLWVVEMRGFMPDIDGEGESQPVGRVSVLEDHDGDGRMDASTIYLDSLILPRALALVPGGALVVENQALWLTQDTDNDLRADTKTLIDPDYAGGALVEHSGNGLWRGVDNWYYNAKSRLRYRLAGGQWIRDSTEFRGQWGMSHDDRGRLYYNYNWSQLHADLVPPNYLSRNKNHTPTSGIDHGLTIDRRVYPIRANPAVNRGYIPGTLDEQGRLLEFTAACSPLYYRGTALGEEYYGNVFVCEPSGNLIKRNIVINAGWSIAAYDPHPGTEFLASTDERFRPVFQTTGPDGALYVADMYRGLVQHGAHVTPYLREQTLQRKLVLPINRGRIWRIVPDGWNSPRQRKLSSATPSELVSELSGKDGWRRDMAQRLLVERADTTVVAELKRLALHGESHLGRFHALWCLEGLGILNADLLFSTLSDSDAQVQSASLRLLEHLAEKDANVKTRLGREIKQMTEVAAPDVIPQLALSAAVLDRERSYPVLKEILQSYDTAALIRDAVLSSLEGQEFAFMKTLIETPGWKNPTPQKEILLEMLTTAALRNADPAELTSLLGWLDGRSRLMPWQSDAITTAITIHGNTEVSKAVSLPGIPGLLKRSGTNPSLANAIHRIFRWPGYTPAETKLESLLDDRQRQQFAAGRRYYLTSCSGCHGTNGTGLPRFGPTLIGSEWVLGDERRLALILLHGLEGPVEVKGKLYDQPEILPVMPSHSILGDGEITAIMTYIRNEWGNAAGPVKRGTVGTTRHTTQGRVMPWTAMELNDHVSRLDKQIENE